MSKKVLVLLYYSDYVVGSNDSHRNRLDFILYIIIGDQNSIKTEASHLFIHLLFHFPEQS